MGRTVLWQRKINIPVWLFSSLTVSTLENGFYHNIYRYGDIYCIKKHFQRIENLIHITQHLK